MTVSFTDTKNIYAEHPTFTVLCAVCHSEAASAFSVPIPKDLKIKNDALYNCRPPIGAFVRSIMNGHLIILAILQIIPYYHVLKAE